jgi:hypothetical protein
VRSVIAPSYGDIFYSNCFQNGVLPIRLPLEQVEALAAQCATARRSRSTSSKTIVAPDGTSTPFAIDPLRREALLHGLDDIGLTLKDDALIRAWQAQDRLARPWAWPGQDPNRPETSMKPALDIRGDARRVIDVVKGGGIAIMPNDVGYAMCGASMDPLRRIYDTKRRGSHKRNAMAAISRRSASCTRSTPGRRRWSRAIVVDHGSAARRDRTFRAGHPLIRSLDEEGLRACTAVGTVGCCSTPARCTPRSAALSREEVVRCSAPRPTSAAPDRAFRVEDIPEELRRIADITIDYGLRRFHIYKALGHADATSARWK